MSTEEDDHRNWYELAAHHSTLLYPPLNVFVTPALRFGWVESRLRHLILSLDQLGPAPGHHRVFASCCHPVANCFHRCVPLDEEDEGTDQDGHSANGERTNSREGAHGTATEQERGLQNGKATHKEGGEEHSIENGQTVNNTQIDSAEPVPAPARTPNRVKSKNSGAVVSIAVPVPVKHTYMSSYLIGLSVEKKVDLNTEPAIQVMRQEFFVLVAVLLLPVMMLCRNSPSK
jgi:hypothetical protein